MRQTKLLYVKERWEPGVSSLSPELWAFKLFSLPYFSCVIDNDNYSIKYLKIIKIPR